MADRSDETRAVHLRLICLTPPPPEHENAPTEFGLQDKKQVVHSGQAQPDGSVHFELDLQAKRSQATNEIRFGGPFVHGTPAAPFLYLSWRHKGAGPSPWIRRLKISLSSITTEQIEAAVHMDDRVLEASVDGSGSGTVPLLGSGWTLQEAGGS